MLVNVVFSWVPTDCTAAMMTTEMPAAMRPYSIAVAPDSSLRNATNLDMNALLAVCQCAEGTVVRVNRALNWSVDFFEDC
jgi:hypothetical protein